MKIATLFLFIGMIIFSCSENKSGNTEEVIKEKVFDTEEEILKSIQGKIYSEIVKEWGNPDSYDYFGKYWKHGIKMRECDEVYINFSLGALQNQKPTEVHCSCSAYERKVYDETYNKQKNDIVCRGTDGYFTYFLNMSGTFNSNPYLVLRDFSDGLAAYGQSLDYSSKGKQPTVYGFINASNEKIIKPIYYEVGNFHEELCWVRSIYDDKKQNIVRYINKEGKEIFEPISNVSEPHDFCNGITQINNKYYDTKGNIVSNPIKTCKYVQRDLNDSLGLIKMETKSVFGLQDQGYKDAWGMEVFKRVPIKGMSGYRKDSMIVVEQKYTFLGNFHYVNGVNYIKEEYTGSTNNIDTVQPKNNLVESTDITSKSDEIFLNGEAIAIYEKVYFYKKADLSTKRKVFIVKGQTVLYDKISGSFMYGTYTNEQGNTTSGWLFKTDFNLLK